jgi:hypothetical protein
MNDKENHEPGDQDFENFIRENSVACMSFPLFVVKEKMRAIQNMYSRTLDTYVNLGEAEPLKRKLLNYLEKLVTTSCETFDQFDFLLIDDDENEGMSPNGPN